ncbi:MAG: hypothetical protein H0V82_06405 [Candidatus Protochlamydia sp.]|nr:hypothetical protein [Candidatus Protochlamydia sp.]
MVHFIEEELAVRLPIHAILSTPVTLDAAKYYAQQGLAVKGKIDVLAAEVKQRQQKINFAYGIIQDINNIIAEDGSLDLSNHPELRERMIVAKTMGINIPMHTNSTEENPICKNNFSNDERERLLQNVNLSTSSWEMDNKQSTQKMQIYLDESNRYLTMVMQAMKYEDKPKRASIQGMGK